jgi:hypothetical protein
MLCRKQAWFYFLYNTDFFFIHHVPFHTLLFFISNWYIEYENALNISLDSSILEHVFRCPSPSYKAVSFWDECWYCTPMHKIYVHITVMVARMNCDEIGHKLQVRCAIKTVRSKYCGVWSEIWVVSLIFDSVFFHLFNWLLEVVVIL